MDMGTLLFICVAGFTAAFVDSVAGGGGIISIPAIMSVGIPSHIALGTNKFGASFGAFASTVTFSKSKKIYFPLIKYLVPFTLIGAVLGVKTVLSIDEKVLQVIILILVFVIAIYTLIKKDFGSSNDFIGLTKKNIIYGCILAFFLGFYDGLFGPGTGSFLIFAFISIYKFDFSLSAGNGKILNFASGIASLATFAISGSVDYLIGIPFALSMILGAFLGTKIAIKNGAKVIKPIFITIALALTLKMLSSIF